MTEPSQGAGLLPCPFCGSAAEPYPDGDMEGHSIMCTGKGALFGGERSDCPLNSFGYATREEAVAAWNRRSLIASSRAASLGDGGGAVAWQVRRTDGSPLACWESCTRELYEATLATGRYSGFESGPSCEVRALAPLGVQVQAEPSQDAEHATWLADKIVALGDYAKEAAAMLRRWPSVQAAPQGADERAAFEKRMHADGWRDFNGCWDKGCWYYDLDRLNDRWVGWKRRAALPLQAPQGQAADMVMLPREPTPEMLAAFIRWFVSDPKDEVHLNDARHGYAAMISASLPKKEEERNG